MQVVSRLNSALVETDLKAQVSPVPRKYFRARPRVKSRRSSNTDQIAARAQVGPNAKSEKRRERRNCYGVSKGDRSPAVTEEPKCGEADKRWTAENRLLCRAHFT